jgi:hypothetical protein
MPEPVHADRRVLPIPEGPDDGPVCEGAKDLQ